MSAESSAGRRQAGRREKLAAVHYYARALVCRLCRNTPVCLVGGGRPVVFNLL